MAVPPHYDLSGLGDILIQWRKAEKGLLNDLEFSRSTERAVSPSILCNMAKITKKKTLDVLGTWAFMSSRLLSAEPEEHVPQLIADDHESFYHVLCWLILRHGKHQLSEIEVVNWLERIFDEVFYDSGMILGGNGKFSALRSLKMEMAKLDKGPTTELVLDLEKTFRVRYIEVPSEETLREVDAIVRSGKGFPESLFEARIWQIKQGQLEHGWVVNRFKVAVGQFCTLSPPAPSTCSPPRSHI
ncbi:hypothetical protein L218DRAFT_1003365 [Marasmius fiardii PR-910]|nr:hypothetical protein L218DRAFT_1003365 [Marasmius fiardii PR-910]